MKKLLLFIIILGLIFGGVYLVLFRGMESDEDTVLYNEQRLIYEGDLMPVEASAVENGQVYLSLDFIKNYIDETIHYDEGDRTVVITNEQNVRRYPLDSLEGTTNDVVINLRSPLKEINGQVMLPIEAFVYDYPVDVKYFQDNKLVIVDRTDRQYMTATVTVNTTYSREEANSDSPIVSLLNKGDKVYVYGETEKWYKIRQFEGRPGYLKKNHLELSYEIDAFEKPVGPEDNEETSILSDERINLVWDYTAVKSNENSVNSLVGVNVISPTWFSLEEDFSIGDRSNINYVERAKNFGMKVWPMFDNSFKEALTESALSKSSTRQKIIADVLTLCKNLGVDGINVDFEGINVNTRDNFTQFMRELYPLFKENNMTVSVDVVPRIFSDVESEPYDRKSLANTSDYVMLMAYDQHWASSPKAGSVAEYSWVESNMNVLFRDIPKEKMVLCLPLYTRIWFENANGISSQTVGMDLSNEYVIKNDIDLVWDDNAKQYFGSKQIGNDLVSIWQEDAMSIREKASLVTKYDLAGVANWRLGFETPNVWNTIESAIKR